MLAATFSAAVRAAPSFARAPPEATSRLEMFVITSRDRGRPESRSRRDRTDAMGLTGVPSSMSPRLKSL